MKRGILTTLTLGLVTSCGDDGSSPAVSWTEHQPAQYVVQTCTHGPSPPGCVRATITHGQVVRFQERVFADILIDGGDNTSWEDFTSEVNPIDGMFNGSAHPKAGCKLSSRTFDKKYGYVKDFELKCEGGSTFGGRYVACFKPGETDIEACAIVPAR